MLRSVRLEVHAILLSATVFASAALVLLSNHAPTLRTKVKSFVMRNSCKNKYDYRSLWMRFSDISSGSTNVTELVPWIAEFIADAIFVQPVMIWLRPQNSDALTLAYNYGPNGSRSMEFPSLQLKKDWNNASCISVYTLIDRPSSEIPIENIKELENLEVKRYVLIQKGNFVLGLLGIGADSIGTAPTSEDDQLLLSISNQLAYLIMNQRLSEELLLARQWESFNRLSSFIIHDLKNLASLQGMTLENAKNLKDNPEFLTDALSTFEQTTDKMINLIASLSVQRGYFSHKQQPVNILRVISHTFDDLRLDQRKGIKLMTEFPPLAPLVSGDPELLQKAFTNILLNAIQSLPKGEGFVEVKVTHPNNGKITTAISDTGCGISREQLKNLFRPFQTTKKNGMGIGLCHTRSIIEVHGGEIRIESQVNLGTKVEVEFPTL